MMHRILTVVKFQLRDSRKALLIFYAVCAALLGLDAYLISQGVDFQVGGFGGVALIFIFVLGLNTFSGSFRFTQANGVSRRSFFFATSLSLFAIAALMAAIDALMTSVLKRMLPYSGWVKELYRTDRLLTDFCWSFALFAFAACWGWLINMIYYRSNTLLKILVSVSPVLVGFLLALLNRWSDGRLFAGVSHWLLRVLGLAGAPNPFTAVGAFLVSTLIAVACVWLLLRRASVRG